MTACISRGEARPRCWKCIPYQLGKCNRSRLHGGKAVSRLTRTTTGVRRSTPGQPCRKFSIITGMRRPEAPAHRHPNMAGSLIVAVLRTDRPLADHRAKRKQRAGESIAMSTPADEQSDHCLTNDQVLRRDRITGRSLFAPPSCGRKISPGNWIDLYKDNVVATNYCSKISFNPLGTSSFAGGKTWKTKLFRRSTQRPQSSGFLRTSPCKGACTGQCRNGIIHSAICIYQAWRIRASIRMNRASDSPLPRKKWNGRLE